MMRIKLNDTVIVISGKDKGKRGKVIDIKSDKNKIKVKGVALLTKHMKARRQGETSQIKTFEGFIDASKIMLVSNVDSKPCRVNFKVLEDGKKVRVNNRTGDII